MERPRYLIAARSPWCGASRGFVGATVDPRLMSLLLRQRRFVDGCDWMSRRDVRRRTELNAGDELSRLSSSFIPSLPPQFDDELGTRTHLSSFYSATSC